MFQTTEYAKQTKWIRIGFSRKECKKRKEFRAYLKTLRLCDSAFSALKTKTLRRQSTRSPRLKPIRSTRGVRVRHVWRHRVLHLHDDRLMAVNAPAVAHADSAVPCSIHDAAEYMNSLEFVWGQALQKQKKNIQLIKYLTALFNLSHFPEGCDPRFSHLPERRAIKNHCRNIWEQSILTNYNL